jgi:2-keto-4-pentenoate hydratase/2-oxohepta-3-ene-1,7-dioic acid hydratase in catechol pathway
MSYKILTYRSAGGPRAGLLIGDQVFDAAAATANPAYQTVLGILNDWALAEASFVALARNSSALEAGMPLSGTSLEAPVLYPGQIFAAGANYADHIDEMKGQFAAKNPRTSGGRVWHFSKSSRSAVVGHGTVRALPWYSSKVDWEIELAAVIGKAASRVPADRALDHVAGYTIANDLSARDFVAREEAESSSPFRFDWIAHKGFDGACPLGPWITPASEIPDPQRLGLKLWVDGDLMQDSSTQYMIFSVAEQIEELSKRVTLHPGDVILTGTPSGVGMGRNLYLKSGQSIRLWIDGIGELRHGFT